MRSYTQIAIPIHRLSSQNWTLHKMPTGSVLARALSIDGVDRNFKNYWASFSAFAPLFWRCYKHYWPRVQFATGDTATKFTPQLGDSGRLIPRRYTPTFVVRRHVLVFVCLDDGRHICNGSYAYEIFITNNYLQNWLYQGTRDLSATGGALVS